VGTGVRTHWPYLTIWLPIDTVGQIEYAISCAYYLIFRSLSALHYGILSAHANESRLGRLICGKAPPFRESLALLGGCASDPLREA
jgi:hypothetical protein